MAMIAKTNLLSATDGPTAGGGTGHAAELDTAKVNRSVIFLQAQMRVSSKTIAENIANKITGKDTVNIIVGIGIPQWVVDYFNIPVASHTDAETVKSEYSKGFYQRKDGVKYVYNPVTKSFVERKFTGGSVRKPSKNMAGITKRSARLNTDILRPKGKGVVTVSISFPYWFSIMMIGQALSTMIKKNNPNSFSINGSHYSFSTSEKVSGRNDNATTGAWAMLATSLISKSSNYDGFYQIYSTGGAMVKSDNYTGNQQ